jgi:hypothetical protein
MKALVALGIFTVEQSLLMPGSTLLALQDMLLPGQIELHKLIHKRKDLIV